MTFEHPTLPDPIPCHLMAPGHSGEFMPREARMERRNRSRLTVMAPVVVRGTGSDGKAFEEDGKTAQLDNVSATGAMLHLQTPVEVGQMLFFVFSFPQQRQLAQGTHEVRIAARGIVRRTGAAEGRGIGIGVEILHHRFMYGGSGSLETNLRS